MEEEKKVQIDISVKCSFSLDNIFLSVTSASLWFANLIKDLPI